MAKRKRGDVETCKIPVAILVAILEELEHRNLLINSLCGFICQRLTPHWIRSEKFRQRKDETKKASDLEFKSSADWMLANRNGKNKSAVWDEIAKAHSMSNGPAARVRYNRIVKELNTSSCSEN